MKNPSTAEAKNNNFLSIFSKISGFVRFGLVIFSIFSEFIIQSLIKYINLLSKISKTIYSEKKLKKMKVQNQQSCTFGSPKIFLKNH